MLETTDSKSEKVWSSTKLSKTDQKKIEKSKKSKKAKPEAKPLTEEQEKALIDLDKLLFDLKAKYPVRSFDIQKIVTSEDLLIVQDNLTNTGCIFLSHAISAESLIHAKQNFVDAFKEMFKYDIPTYEQLVKIDRNDISSINQFRSPKFGAGNASFAYLNKQYTELDKTPTSVIGGEKVYFALNTVHSKVNLPLLLENTHTTAVLLALTHRDGMISWDSAKYANNPKPTPVGMTKQELTKFHFDKYSKGDSSRVQAILVSEQDVKLGYVPYTHRPDVQRLIAKALGKPNLYNLNGFIGCDVPVLTKVLEKHLIAPDTNSLVIWTETVIHAEASFGKPNSFGYCEFVSRKDQPNTDRFRFVVGSHIPSQLSTEDLTKLAHHCEKGLIPDFYFSHNAGTKVWDNIKNGKSTQYKKPRKISDLERIYITDAIQDAKNPLEMTPLKKHLYGITQTENQLVEFSEADRKLLFKN